MRYCFDLDQTLCSTQGVDYATSIPSRRRIQIVKELYKSGNEIVIHTARGTVSRTNFEDLTRRQLNHWGLDFAELVLGKPAADYYVDDRGISDLDFFGNHPIT